MFAERTSTLCEKYKPFFFFAKRHAAGKNLSTRRTMLKYVASAAAVVPMLAWPARGQTPRRRVRVGQMGVGHAHASKLAAYRASDDYEVVGVVEPDEGLRHGAQADPVYQGLPWMTHEQLLNTPGLDAVLVETRVRDLLDTAEACIAAGKHIHLDKPAGESLPHFRRIVEAAQRQHLMIQLGYMYRYNPGVVLLRQILRQGWLGDVFEVHAVMSKVVAPDSRRVLAEYPGGIMFELGGHVMDLVIGVLGKPRSVTPFAQRAARTADNLVDNMLAVLTYDRAIASVKSSALEVEGFARRHLVVCGTEGTFQIQPLDDPAVRVALSRDREQYRSGYQDVVQPKYTRYVGDAADMASVIRGEKEFLFSYQHDLDVQQALLQACELPIE
jgi:predicted dehydrogenase